MTEYHCPVCGGERLPHGHYTCGSVRCHRTDMLRQVAMLFFRLGYIMNGVRLLRLANGDSDRPRP